MANAQLRGNSCDIAAALVQQFVNFADNEILPAACTWTFPTLGIMQYNKQVSDAVDSKQNKSLFIFLSGIKHTGSLCVCSFFFRPLKLLRRQ